MMPTSMTKPMREMTLSSVPLSSRARKPPVKARGMVNMTMSGSRRDWNWATMTKYTSTTPSSSISMTCPMASIMASFSPLNWMVTSSGSSMASTALVTWADTSVTLLPSAMPAVTVTQRRC